MKRGIGRELLTLPLRIQEGAQRSDAKRGLDFDRVKTDDHGPIDDGDRGCHVPDAPELLDGSCILGNVAFVEANSFLRKILFRPFTKHSTRLREHRNSLLHRFKSS